MRWTQVVLLLSAILLLAEGVVFLKKPPRRIKGSLEPQTGQRWSGGFMISLAALALLWFLIHVYGRPVFSFEFGALMVRGTATARIALPLLLGLLPVAALLAWWTCCSPYRPIRRGSGPWLTAAALIAGMLTALQVHSVGPDLPGVYDVYSYDLWAAILIVWLVFCLTGCILGLFRSGSTGSLLWGSTTAITAVGLYAYRQPVNTASVLFFGNLRDAWSVVPIQLGLSSSETMWGGVWMLCIAVFLPLSMALAAWLFLHTEHRWFRGAWAFAALIAGAFILLDGAWPLWMLFTFLAIILAAHRRWESEGRQLLKELTGWQWFFVGLLLTGLIVGLMITSHFSQFDMTVGLLGVLLVLIGLAEVLVGGPLVLLGRELRGLVTAEARQCRSWWQRLGDRFRRRRDSAGVSSQPARLFDLLKALVSPTGLVKLAILVLLLMLSLVFIFELPNAGKTLVEPFKVAGMAGDDKLGVAMSDSLAGAIGRLQRELRPDLLTMQSVTNRASGKGSRGTQARYTPSEQDAGLSAEVPQDSNLELGNVKVPFQVLISPFEPLVRKALGVRVISGSLHEYQSRYILMVRDSDGRTWSVELPRTRASEPSKAPWLSDALPPMMEQLAFEIVSEDPLVAEAGLTRSWAAFEVFRKGLKDWERSEVNQDAEARSSAILMFQDATRRDPGFALAHYRLGRALQRDGQPARAVEALRNAVQANPQFLPGQVALGFLLYDNSNPSLRTTVASPPPKPWSQPPAGSRPEAPPGKAGREASMQAAQTPGALHEDALGTWYQTIQQAGRTDALDQAQAYYGLCLSKTDAAFKARLDTLRNVEKVLDREAPKSKGPSVALADTTRQLKVTAHTVRLAYFYCKRAEGAYDSFPRQQRASQVLREGKAQVLNALGTLLERSEQQPAPPAEQRQWGCFPEELHLKAPDTERLGPRRNHQAQAALKYYERAAELSDHPVIQCNAASVALLLGQPERMERLEKEPAAHIYRAGIHLRRAKQFALDSKAPGLESRQREELMQFADANHEAALDEFQRAVLLDPSNIDALNGYAYTFWQWRYHSIENPRLGPEPEDAARAEQYARHALALSRDRRHSMQGVQVHSTLGEVLLARARPNEAIQVLKEVEATAPEHPFFDEVRWDLAQAYLCDAHNGAESGLPRSEVQALRKKAVRLLEQIQKNDLSREDKLFPGDQGVHMAQMIDPSHVQQVCNRLREPPPDRGPGDSDRSYVLRRGWPRYQGHDICDWVGVEVDVYDSRKKPVEGLTLHIWGGGVEARSRVGEAPVQLGFRPQATRDYYFVQLEDERGRPVSGAHALRTHANDEHGRCSKNHIRLVFDQQDLAKRAPGQARRPPPKHSAHQQPAHER